mgnify:CR=1 FL=1
MRSRSSLARRPQARRSPRWSTASPREKFFPAAPTGGPQALRALAGPLPEVIFCPTGGIDRATSADYLALANVACVGGSWLTPTNLVAAQDWNAITALAADVIA